MGWDRVLRGTAWAWCALIAGACGSPVPATKLAWREPAAAAAPVATVDSYALLPAGLRVAVTQLDARARAIAASDEFRAHLERIDAMGGRGRTLPMSGHRVALLLRNEVAGFTTAPVCFAYEPGGGTEAAAAEIVRPPAASLCDPAANAITLVTLRSITAARIQSAVLEERACAINTLVHERAHAVVDAGAASPPAMVFLDRGHHRQPNPVVSYVLGALAQCLYLGVAAVDVPACVEAVGTNTFDISTCAAGWGARWRP